MELETENDTAAIVDEIRMAELRRKFLNRCISYIGVPYKKKYQKPGSKIIVGFLVSTSLSYATLTSFDIFFCWVTPSV